VFHAWIESVLPAPLTGPVEVTKEVPWSMVASVPTERGRFWFKENRAGTRYEAGLIGALGAWAPDRVLVPVAVEPGRGWSLLPDGGPTLRATDTTPSVAHWEQMLADHAAFQRTLTGRVDELLALGVPDVRPAAIAKQADRLPVPPTYVETLRELCRRLDASEIPASLQHDDLHDANVFASGRVFDWGDASVAHPFGVLLISLRVATDRFGVRAGDPVLARLRDAYLEPWSDLADRASLIAEVEAAVQVTKVSRALSWERSLVGADAAALAEYGPNVQGWLDELLEPNDL
jgi:hypothetical protein